MTKDQAKQAATAAHARLNAARRAAAICDVPTGLPEDILDQLVEAEEANYAEAVEALADARSLAA